jgi:formate dehydrogenase major subunit
VLHVVIDGARCECEEGTTILGALRAHGIDLPTLCHDDRLTPSGVCRLCLVRVGQSVRPVPACSTALSDGMRITTDSPDLRESRRWVLSALARRYPADALRRAPSRPFHRYLCEYGLDGETGREVRSGIDDRSHPYIAVDTSRCIDCYRCVQICDEVQGQHVWHVRARGVETRIVPDGPDLAASSCVGCGACVDTCPTGALEDAGTPSVDATPQWTRTVCPYCGIGCEIAVATAGGRIAGIRPVLDAVVNRGHLCVKGRYAYGFVTAPDRVTRPMLREQGVWRATTWTEARAFVASRLTALVRAHGPDSVGILASARATNEDNYVAQKFARTVIGTNNVDCCARVCHAPSAAALKTMLGAGLATNSFDDIERARAILVCGANPLENHPVVGARIRQAARRGAGVIVIDPRRTELAECARYHLAIRPGTDIALLNAMAHTIIAEGLHDREFIAARVDGFERYTTFIDAWPAERAASLCDVDPELIRRAARLYAGGSPAMTVHGLGMTEHAQGTESVMALINLALLTGNVGKPGSGVNPLRGQNNVQGAAHMGCDPDVLPGSLSLDHARERFEEGWNTTLPSTRGLRLHEMLDAASAGRLKALWVIGYDVLLTNANAIETARALGALELVIVQDLFLNETASRCGSVFLPACSSFEKDGTFMNAERRIQRVRAAMPPRGASKPDWQIICDIARAMDGRGFAYREPREIWNEVRTLCEGAAGMSYARLDTQGLQWPCPSEDDAGTPILHRGAFASGARAELRLVQPRAAGDPTTAEFPFVLMTGRSLYPFNAGTMTGRTPNRQLRPDDVLDISLVDADRLGIASGQHLRIVSRYGEAVLPARPCDLVQPGQLFATFHTAASDLNRVTGPIRDDVTGAPQYKWTAVRIEL